MRKKRAARNTSSGAGEQESDRGQDVQDGLETQDQRSALDTYRMWLNESSSSSSGDGGGGGGSEGEDRINTGPADEGSLPMRDRPSPQVERPTPIRDQASPLSNRPSPLPHGPSPLSDRSPARNGTAARDQRRTGDQHLQPPKPSTRSHTQSPSSHTQSPSSPTASPRNRLRLQRPRRFLAQSLRAMLPSPSPSPSPGERLHPRVPRRISNARRGSSDAGMATLYGDAWLAQPHDTGGGREKPAQIVRTSGAFEKTLFEKPGFDEVSLEEADEKAGSDRSARCASYRWSYSSPDSRGAWLVALGGLVALWASWSPLASYPVFAAYYNHATRGALGLSGPADSLYDTAWGGDRFPPQESRYTHGAAVLGVMTGALHVASAQAATWLGGELAARGAQRSGALAGALLATAGFAGAAFCRPLGGVCVLQGVLGGFGCGLLAAPVYSLVPGWFTQRRRRLACALVSGMGAALSLATCAAAHVLIQRHGTRAALLLHSALTLSLGPLAALLLRARTPLVPCALPWGVPLGCVLLSALLGTCARTLHVLSLPAHMRRMHEDPAHAMYALMAGFTGGTLAGAWMDAWCWCCVAGEVVCGVAALAVWTPAKGPAPVVAACVGVGLGAGMCAVGIVGYVGRRWGGGAVARVLGCVGLAAAAGALLAAPAAVEFERSAPGNTQWLAALAGVLSLGAAALAALPMLPAVKQREAGEQDRSSV